MAATITIPAGNKIKTANYIDGDSGGTGVTQNLNTTIESITISGLTSSEFDAASVDGAVGTPSLRSLVTDGTSTTAGKALGAADPRLTTLTAAGYATADKIATSGTAVTISSTAPTNGQVLTATSATTAAWSTPGAGVEITGTGTISSSGTTVTGVGTAFTSELKVGDLIKADSIIRTITSIAGDTSLTVDSAPTAPWSADAFTFIQSAKIRPFNVALVKIADYTVLATDAGTAIVVDTSGGNVAITLCAVTAFKSGDTITVRKTTDDTNTVTITRAGADTIDGETSVTLSTYGASVTLMSDASATWQAVCRRRLKGEALNYAQVRDNTQQTITDSLTLATTPTTANTTQVTTLTASITPKSQNTIIRVRGVIHVGASTAGMEGVFAVFSTVSATPTLRGSFQASGPQGARNFTIPIDLYFTSGTTSAITIDVYAASTSGSLYYNGNYAGNALWGGTAYSQLVITEEAI